MGIKRYISIGICVILSLTAIILNKEDKSVKTGVKGRAESIETVEEVGEVLNAFAPRLSANGAVYREIEMPSITGMAYETESENLPQNRFKSATITIEAKPTYGNHYPYWEKMTCYVTEDISYYVVEGITTEKSNATMAEDVGNIESWKCWENMFLEYKTEIYIDKDVSLMRISKFAMEQAKEQSISFKNSKPSQSVKNEEKTSCPKGLQLNQWYNLKDLEFYDYSFSPNLVKEFAEEAVAMIIENADKFELDNYLDFGNLDKITGEKLYTYSHVKGVEYEWRDARFADINLREDKCPMINYRSYYEDYRSDYKNDYQITFILENVNATTIEKLEKPNIAKIDEKALTEEK